MSYTFPLHCGCRVLVSGPSSEFGPCKRVIGRRGTACRYLRHRAGARVWLWELLPDVAAEHAPSEELLLS